MLNSIFKLVKFISSRFLLFIIGIFLAIGATYIYAAWDDAKTGDSGLLTETNWNELVTMTENNLDVTVSSRLAAASYTAERGTDNAALASNYTATRAGYLDTLKTGPRGPVVAMSAERVGTLAHGPAAKYCYDLSATAEVAMDGDTTTTYTDWRLPTVGEAAVFEGTITDTSYVWTATVYEATYGNWIILRLSDGDWTYDAYVSNYYVRCVR